MSATTLRRLKIIELLSEKPGNKFSVVALQKKLNSAGIEVPVRTLQRDLNALLTDHRISADQKNPQGWSWVSNETWLDAIRVDAHTALALLLSQEQLKRILPPNSWRHLTPILEKAEEVLADFSDTGSVGSWLDRIAVLPWGPPLQAPSLVPGIQETVTQAVLEGRQLELSYRPGKGKIVRNHRVNPLGLVYREQILYLVSFVPSWIDEVEEEDDEETEEAKEVPPVDKEQILLLALHRIQKAVALKTPRTEPPGFQLREYAEKHVFSDNDAEGEFEITFRIRKEAGQFLLETPLSKDQKAQPKRNWIYVTATVPDTWQCIWWLQSFGSAIEVLYPPRLRKEFVEMTKGLAKLYLKRKMVN